jgi:transposase
MRPSPVPGSQGRPGTCWLVLLLSSYWISPAFKRHSGRCSDIFKQHVLERHPASRVRNQFQFIERQVAEAELDWWCGWAARSRLSPFRDLAKTVREHWDGILAYFDTHMTSATIEAVNGIIQLAKRMARGFKNFVYFRTAAYHRAGKLKLAVPNLA